MRNPRRAYQKDGTEIAPMDLRSMREHGIRSVSVECRRCQHTGVVNVDALADNVPVPDVAVVLTKLRCSECGANGETLYVRPDWTGFNAPGMGRSSGGSA